MKRKQLNALLITPAILLFLGCIAYMVGTTKVHSTPLDSSVAMKAETERATHISNSERKQFLALLEKYKKLLREQRASRLSTRPLRVGGILPSIDLLWSFLGYRNNSGKVIRGHLTEPSQRQDIEYIIANLKKHLLELDLRDISSERMSGGVFKANAVVITDWQGDFWHHNTKYYSEVKISLHTFGRQRVAPFKFDYVVSPSMKQVSCGNIDGEVLISLPNGQMDKIDLKKTLEPIVHTGDGQHVLCLARIPISPRNLRNDGSVKFTITTRCQQETPYSFVGEIVSMYDYPIEEMKVQVHFRKCPTATWGGRFNQYTGIVELIGNSKETSLGPFKRLAHKEGVWVSAKGKLENGKLKHCVLRFSDKKVTPASSPLIAYYSK